MARKRRTQIKWHRFLAKGFELSVGQRGVLVLAEIEVTQNPPKADILLLRRETEAWTPEQAALLPDGIRDCNARHVLLEFKYSESLTADAIRQAISYEYFYRTTNDLTPHDVKMFLLCAKTPNPARLRAFGYEESPSAGVYDSNQELIEHIPLLVLNQLSDAPHNAVAKAFASRPAQKEKAFSAIRRQTDASDELLTYFEVLRTIWALPEGATMDEMLTPERVLEIGREWKRILIQHTPAEEMDELLSSEHKQHFIEQGINQKIHDIVLAMHEKGFDPDVIADIAGLTTEQVQALLQESHSTGSAS